MGFGFFGYSLCLGQSCRRRRFAIAVLLSALVLGIGFSRIYLRAHWLTDVVGGFALGLAWLSLCIGFLGKWNQQVRSQADKEAETEMQPALSELVA